VVTAPSRVLVTGAAGVLGSRVTADLLAAGTHVVGYDLRELPPAAGLTVVTGDVRDETALSEAADGCDAVVHCASALPSYPKADIRSIIVDGARSMTAAAAKSGVGRVVHISSTAVYGLPSLVPTPEDHPHEPVDAYSAAKAEAEALVVPHRADRCVTVVRPKTFLGPGRLGLFGMLFEWAEEGRDFPVIGKGDVRVQMLDLDDLARAVRMVLAAPEDAAADTYNIGAAEFGTLREDFQAVLDEVGRGRRIRSVPAAPAIALLRAASALGLSPVYDRLVRKLKADSYVDISKAAERLGFHPEHSNRDAILRTFRWWRERPQAPRGAAGATSSDRWRQGMLAGAKILFPPARPQERRHDQPQDRGAVPGRPSDA
jgi:nucleoside-diphosphate-sugar epimerase